MVERCLIAASLAALVCHPSSTIICFKPTPISPQQNKLKDSKPHYSFPPKDPKLLHLKEEDEELPPKPNKNHHPHHARTTSSSSKPRKKKAISELVGKDHPSVGIAEDIMRSGWNSEVGLKIDKVFRVNHSKNVLAAFEEYRQEVISAYKKCRISKQMEHLVVDGNELLQFHGAAVTCSLGIINGETSICQRKCCQVCRMLASEFSGDDNTTMSFFDISWRAHQKVSMECLKRRVCARKAIVMCRVIAGRVAHFHANGIVENEWGEFDSVMAGTGDSKELLVLNSKAVLPCFLIIYKAEKPF